MPSLELAAGQVLTAAHTNTYWMRQAVASVPSGARPTGYEGRPIYETDTDALMIYASATTGWRPPWNLPWGAVAAPALVTASQTGITAVVDLTGLTITATAVANRRWKITGNVRVTQNTAAGVPELYITDGSNVTKNRRGITLGAGETGHIHCEADVVTAAGSQTFKLRLTVGSGTVDLTAAADLLATLRIEDIGPAGAPA